MLSKTLLLFSCLTSSTTAFTASSSNSRRIDIVATSTKLHAVVNSNEDNDITNNISSSSSRRNFMEKMATSSVAFLGVIGSTTAFTPLPAYAEVSQGNSLPEGAAQFKRLINLKSDIPLVLKRVTENASEIDKKEWDNLSDFLRRVYKGGEDMKAFTKTSIYDPEKKKKAEECVKFLQKFAQAGDGPVSKQDAEGYAAILKKTDDVLETFFDLLRDVPDEL